MKLEVGKTYLNIKNKRVKIIAQDFYADQYIGRRLQDNELRLYSPSGLQIDDDPYNRPADDHLVNEIREPRKISGHLWCRDKEFLSLSKVFLLGWQYEKTETHTVKCKITIEEIIE